MKPELKCYTFSFVCGDDAFFFDIVSDDHNYAMDLAHQKFLRLVSAFIFEDPDINLSCDPIYINDLVDISEDLSPELMKFI